MNNIHRFAISIAAVMAITFVGCGGVTPEQIAEQAIKANNIGSIKKQSCTRFEPNSVRHESVPATGKQISITGNDRGFLVEYQNEMPGIAAQAFNQNAHNRGAELQLLHSNLHAKTTVGHGDNFFVTTAVESGAGWTKHLNKVDWRGNLLASTPMTNYLRGVRSAVSATDGLYTVDSVFYPLASGGHQADLYFSQVNQGAELTDVRQWGFARWNLNAALAFAAAGQVWTVGVVYQADNGQRSVSLLMQEGAQGSVREINLLRYYPNQYEKASTGFHSFPMKLVALGNDVAMLWTDGSDANQRRYLTVVNHEDGSKRTKPVHESPGVGIMDIASAGDLIVAVALEFRNGDWTHVGRLLDKEFFLHDTLELGPGQVNWGGALAKSGQRHFGATFFTPWGDAEVVTFSCR